MVGSAVPLVSSDEALKQLQQTITIRVRENVAGSDLTTFSIGGAIRYLVEPQSEAELIAVLRVLSFFDLPYRVIGAGSNLLIPDAGIEGWVIRLGRGFRYYRAAGDSSFEVGAAMSYMTLSRDLSEKGFSGLEFAGGIPASAGGAVRMNAGAHGGETAEVIQSVRFLLRSGERQELGIRNLRFAYRSSDLPADAIVTSITISLVHSSKEKTEGLRQQFLDHRRRYQPLSLCSAGSVFRNPDPTQTAGRVIEAAGLRGRQIGGAKISELHGNWIVNPEKRARSEDVEALIALCVNTVREQRDIVLEPELIRW